MQKKNLSTFVSEPCISEKKNVNYIWCDSRGTDNPRENHGELLRTILIFAEHLQENHGESVLVITPILMEGVQNLYIFRFFFFFSLANFHIAFCHFFYNLKKQQKKSPRVK